MKAKKALKIAGLLFVMTLITASVISGIFAKYTTTNNGTGSVKVADWVVSSKIKSNTGNETLLKDAASTSFSLFSTNYQHVKVDRVAPGTKGSFSVSLNAVGTEVDVGYTITLKLPNTFPKDKIVIYETDETTVVNPTDDGTNYVYTMNTGVLTMTTQTKDIPFFWEWTYYEDAPTDVTDTALGSAVATNDFIGTVSAEFVQVMPV